MADWTDEEDDLLKYLTESGLSATVIATHFKGRSRNAIIGRQHRSGLKVKAMRASPKLRKSSLPLKPTADSRQWENLNINVVRLRELREKVEASAPPARRKPRQEDPDAPIPLMLPLLDLENDMCRWVVTDESPFLYCGHKKKTGTSYCEHHFAKMHTKAKPVQRSRAA